MCFIFTRRVQDNLNGAPPAARPESPTPLTPRALGALGALGAPWALGALGALWSCEEPARPHAPPPPLSGAPTLPRELALPPLSTRKATSGRGALGGARGGEEREGRGRLEGRLEAPLEGREEGRGGGRDGPGDALGAIDGAPFAVRALLVAEGVRRRQPVGVATRFPHTVGHLWGLVELNNPSAVRQVRLRWRHRGALKGDFPFTVGRGLKWREWSRVLVSPEDLGDWSLELYDAQRERVVQVSAFDVYPAGAESAAPEEGAAPATARLAEAAPAEQPSAVERLVVAAGVRHRLPVGVDERFSGVERVWGYLEMRHSGPPLDLWMEWVHEGELRSRLSVKVAEGKRWRTWSWQRLSPQRDAGRWEVRLTTAAGEVLAQTQFIID